MAQRALYLAAYDVVCDSRRRRVLQVVRQYASGGQKSAFECWLSATEVREMLLALDGELDEIEDRFGLLPLDPRRRVVAMGCARPPSNPDFLYFG
ncbi:MAG: CRISPR-associated endonuclease Cas2 [Gammaproteobacteria bacterium]|nr:CRISPR-associated endonuclease Cas2 [Gammaproteobacteria bacterium]